MSDGETSGEEVVKAKFETVNSLPETIHESVIS